MLILIILELSWLKSCRETRTMFPELISDGRKFVACHFDSSKALNISSEVVTCSLRGRGGSQLCDHCTQLALSLIICGLSLHSYRHPCRELFEETDFQHFDVKHIFN